MAESAALFQLVVVGASAGGIEALSTFVSTLPADFAAPVIIAQHLDPSRPSHLEQILARRAHLPVITVQDHAPLQPGTIYVVPSNSHVALTNHDLTLVSNGERRPKPSVDLLLRSAAAIFGEQLIAVILTGTGSDGTAGAYAVKQAGGIVIIQNPLTAAYPGMPESLAAETVDVVAHLEEIGPLICRLLAGAALPDRPDSEHDLLVLLEQLHAQSGVDFQLYKRATILRRLQGRIAATGSLDLAGYLVHLTAHPEEQQRLVSSFLIKVTQFMRDPEIFAYLREQLLPALHAALPAQEPRLRIWSAGCATGEEAYSLAIMVCEELGVDLERVIVKIFATDLDVDAISYARRGIYPTSALADVPPALIDRYFVANGTSYTVSRRIRSLVVFGEHDLSQRAPFPQIDLVLCRNVLIYFTRELQQRALQLFAFALRDGGTLVLGRTESISPLAESFVPVQALQHIYRRQGPRIPVLPLRFSSGTPLMLSHTEQRQRRNTSRDLLYAQQELKQIRSANENLLLHLPVGVVVVDGHYDIQEINVTARRLLAIRSSALGEDVVHLAQHIAHRALRSAIDRAVRLGETSQFEAGTIVDPITEKSSVITIGCYPHPPGQTGAPASQALLLVTDVTKLVGDRRALTEAAAQQQTLTDQLAQSNAELQAANASLARRTDELQQAVATLEQARCSAEERAARHLQQLEQLAGLNRELVEANEDLNQTNIDLRALSESYALRNEETQAAIEEVETLNEEMQASNEELETLNEELQAAVEELNTSNADLSARGDELAALTETLAAAQQHSAREAAQLAAILTGIADAVLVVDPTGATLLSNATYTQWFSPTTRFASEAGHPLPAEESPQVRAAHGEHFKMTFTQTKENGDRRWYEAIGQPVQSSGAQTWGVVVIRDITERSLRRMQEQFIGLVSHELRTPLTTITAALNAMDRLMPEDADARRYLRMAQPQAQRLARLIDDLWEVTRLQRGTFTLNLEAVALAQLVALTVEIAQSLTTNQTITLSAEDGPLLVQGDADRLQQVVFNLLKNAITHAPYSASIRVHLRQVNGARAELMVEDDGPGIAPEQLSNLFTRYTSAPGSQRRKVQGLGLGLFIVHQIVTAHGGTITVHSRLDEGTTFTVALPLLGA